MAGVVKQSGSQKESPQAIRAELTSRLRTRVPEIEQTIFTRISSLSKVNGGSNGPVYEVDLRRAVMEALSYGLEGIEKGKELPVSSPPETARQARRAAREGVRLDTMLRCYVAGNKLLEEFVVAEADGISSQLLCQILSDQGPRFDRLMELAAAEYEDELQQIERSAVQKQADRIMSFLKGGSSLRPVDVDYDFDQWHVGVILAGRGGEMAIRVLVEQLGCGLLKVVPDHETVWAWIGSRRRLDIAELARLLGEDLPSDTLVAIGEPRKGLNGWRQTFREAQIALQVVFYQPLQTTRCRDVILVSAVLRDPFLTASLIDTYLAPLAEGRGDIGKILRRTLRAYFEADGNAASAASALGVARNTVERHIRRVEAKLGQNLASCSAQMQVALHAEELLKLS